MRVAVRACLMCCLCLWSWTAQAYDARFSVPLDFTDAGVAPPIPEQVRQALPILWLRLLPSAAPSALRGVRAMSLLRSIHPHGLQSVVVFDEQRVRDLLQSRDVSYIPKQPVFHLSVSVLNTVGQHDVAQEQNLLEYMMQQGADLGMQLQAGAPSLSFRVQWLNDVQFYVSAAAVGQATLRTQNQWKAGVDAAQQLKSMMRTMLLQVRNSDAQQAQNAVHEPVISAEPIALYRFQMHVEGLRSLGDQVMLERALRADARVQSLIPTQIQQGGVDYTVVATSDPDIWLEYWFDARGMTASKGLEGWLAQ